MTTFLNNLDFKKEKNSITTGKDSLTHRPLILTPAQPFMQLCRKQLKEHTQLKPTSRKLLKQGRMQEFRQ